MSHNLLSLEGVIYRGLYWGIVLVFLRGILGVQIIAHMQLRNTQGFTPHLIAISHGSRGVEEQQPTPPGRISSGCAEGLGFRAAAPQSVPKPLKP